MPLLSTVPEARYCVLSSVLIYSDVIFSFQHTYHQTPLKLVYNL